MFCLNFCLFVFCKYIQRNKQINYVFKKYEYKKSKVYKDDNTIYSVQRGKQNYFYLLCILVKF